MCVDRTGRLGRRDRRNLGRTWGLVVRAAASGLAVIGLGTAPALATTVDAVAKIFQQRCLNCHGDQQAKGGVTLTHPGQLVDDGYVDPGEPDSSVLTDLITPHAGEAAMPKDAAPLNKEEIASVKRWIAGGAMWPEGRTLQPFVVRDRDWWSLRPLPQPRVPEPGEDRDAAGGGHPVDAFLETALAERDLTPVELADPRTLIRRVTYDLTGLPPTPEEVERFVAACRRDPEAAWAELVDRLLASPAFGEKWAQHWLDVARYAETHGYDKDQPRENAWPYRDYVIRSLNEDKPYTRFAEEQIAGDVLYPEQADGVLGVGFLAAGPWDFIGHQEVGEGKLDGRIAKHLDRDEMASAVFNVFLSTTIQCAQCHNHKFDPIRMEDYYRVHAVFAAVDRANRVYAGLSAAQRHRERTLQDRLAEVRQHRQRLSKQTQRRIAAETSSIDHRIAALKERYGNQQPQQPASGYHSQISRTAEVVKWVQVDLGQPHRAAEIALIPAYDDFNDIGAGFCFPVRYRVEVADDPSWTKNVRVLSDATATDQPNPGARKIRIDGGGTAFRAVRITATRLRERKDDFAFALGEVEVIEAGTGDNVARGCDVTASDSIEQAQRWRRRNLVDEVFFLELTDAAAAEQLARLRVQRAAIETKLRDPKTEQRLQDLADQQRELESELEAIPEGQLVYAAATHFPGRGRFVATEGQPREIHLLNRGDLRSPGRRLLPGAPPLWSSASERFVETASYDEGRARAALASYVTDRQNPLFYRSIANRVWGWTFGAPLVGTPNDFGRGGMQPTHPELLDYLACRLRDDPRSSLKTLVRLLVTSRAYRRSSRSDPEAVRRDAANAFRWRADRRRLTAEEFRDSLLAISGVLDRRRGGPSFRDFVIEKPQHSPHYRYDLKDPASRDVHRRSVYRFVVRSQPQPLLTTLDCADPSISTPVRGESTTPLQALTAWNHPLVEFASRRFGERITRQADTAEQQVEHAFRLLLGRAPTGRGRAVLLEHRRRFGPASLARVLFNTNAFVYLD